MIDNLLAPKAVCEVEQYPSQGLAVLTLGGLFEPSLRGFIMTVASSRAKISRLDSPRNHLIVGAHIWIETDSRSMNCPHRLVAKIAIRRRRYHVTADIDHVCFVELDDIYKLLFSNISA